MRLGRLEEAERTYLTLIDRNPDNIFYYKQIEKCRKLGKLFLWKFKNCETSDEINNRSELIALYESFIEKRPKAPIPKLLHLHYLEGSAFEENVFTYLISCLRRGIPSLFKNLVLLYSDPQKVK